MEGVVVRRVIPSDNSCLFNAVGYVCHSTVPVLSNYFMIMQIKLFLPPCCVRNQYVSYYTL
jgi:hypothetical protein